MIIEQVNEFGRMPIAIVGELVPVGEDAFGRIWDIIEFYYGVHKIAYEKLGHTYHIEINGEYVPANIHNGQELMEWYRHD